MYSVGRDGDRDRDRYHQPPHNSGCSNIFIYLCDCVYSTITTNTSSSHSLAEEGGQIITQTDFSLMEWLGLFVSLNTVSTTGVKRLIKRFPFSPSLRLSSVVVELQQYNENNPQEAKERKSVKLDEMRYRHYFKGTYNNTRI